MKTVVVTGATSGIGFEVCAALLKSGCRVIGLGRSAENARAAEEKLRGCVPAGDITFFHGDLMLPSEVRALAVKIKEELEKTSGGRLHALVNNAGCVRNWYMTTPEGYEHQLALNHLAGFLLTHELLPNLLEGGRVVMTSSGSHRMMRMHWQDVMYERRYRPLMAYKQSKLCNMLFAYGLNDRYAGLGLRAYGVDPGLVRTEIGSKNTGGLVGFVWARRKKHGVDPSVPAEIYARLIGAETAPDGLCHDIRGPRAASRQVGRRNAERLFELSEKLCGIKFGGIESCMS
ncbi:NAD(P)-dependent dehydrogenase, short-chain alcohol dehydrogenase family [Sporobacter termitidis DSM 10068]|uniref:NAD(P)-dependent dehydrogenase, short-chain alcohol dehydrogenase family n=1 Tax=Sporobacter termitidis DSM 10068 TaxID=1123282 RepID=A0A1M5YVQ5_9FIRM|nr:SDR family NAD(P)-dependent oxidoreductase [Sporobacter termitidis]SHI16156.1 NAD(P)-dependent dehydrogenase, short-chain alcohol dehydrogenase family [Sporobacter termitidis DSM 10068]